MNALPAMFIAWAIFVTGFVALMVYRGNLTRYEEEQLFLTDSANHQQEEQSVIVSRVKRIQPYIHIFGGAAAALTVAIVGVYVWNAWQVIHS